MGDSEYMKQRLNVSTARLGINQYTKTAGKVLDKYIDRIWNQFGHEIKSHGGTGEPVTKQEFSDLFRSYYRQEASLNPNAKISTNLKKALAKYDRSSLYRNTDERLRLISSDTIFEDPEIADIFRRKAGLKKRETFQLKKYQFNRRGELEDGRIYTVNIYEGNTYVVQLNSPLETIILTAEEFEQSIYNQ